MNILFVTMVAFENNASATIRNKGVIKGMSEIGHNIDIMTLRPSEDAINFDDTMNDINGLINKKYYIDINSKYAKFMTKKQKPIKQENASKAKSNVLKNVFKIMRKDLKKIYTKLSVFDAQKMNVKCVSKLDINYNKYDVIISSSDPKSSHLIVGRIFKENRCTAKWIQYWGDPMLMDITRKNNWIDGFVKHYEKMLIQKSDRVLYASPLTLNVQKDIFPESAFKMDYVNQSYINVINETNSLDDEITDIESISVGYFGAYISTVRNIIPLYDVAKIKNFKLNICGNSDVLLMDTKNISIHGILSYEEVTKMEKDSDVLVCICNNKGTQIPGKIYYCASYNKPIIIILDGEYQKELRKYFETFDRYIICENTESSIMNAIEEARNQLKKHKYVINEQLTPKFMGMKILDGIK